MIQSPTATQCCFVLVACVLLSFGCATVKGEVEQNRYQEFTDSLIDLKSGTSELLDNLAPLSKTRYLKELEEEMEAFDAGSPVIPSNCGDSRLEDLRLEETAGRLEIPCIPHYLRIGQFQSKIDEVMDNLIKYGQLLTNLAAGELVDVREVEAQAQEINGGITSAFKTIMPDEVAAITAVGPFLTDLWIDNSKKNLQNRQVEALNNRVTDAQPSLVKVVDLMQHTIERIQQALETTQKTMARQVLLKQLWRLEKQSQVEQELAKSGPSEPCPTC